MGIRNLTRDDLQLGPRRDGRDDAGEGTDEPHEQQAPRQVEDAVGQGHPLGVSRLPDGGHKRRNAGAQVVAQQNGNGAVQTNDASAVNARLSREVLQHGDGGAGALHYHRHEGAHQHAQQRHAHHLGNHVGEDRVRGQGLHNAAHGVDAQEQQTEAKDGAAAQLDVLLLRQAHDDKAHEHDGQHVVGQLEGDDLRRDGGADVRAHDDGDGLAQFHQPCRHETDGHNRGGAGALQHCRSHRASQHADNGVLGDRRQNGAHAVARSILQAAAHEVHTVEKNGQTAQKAQSDLHQLLHCFSFAGAPRRLRSLFAQTHRGARFLFQRDSSLRNSCESHVRRM